MRLVGIPVKGFGMAKVRLAGVLDAAARSALGRRVAARTVDVARAVVGDDSVLVVTGDADVVAWAEAIGVSVIDEDPGGLDGAAAAVVAAAGGRPWAVVHADLPLLTRSELGAALAVADASGAAIAPSSDGGTSLIAATGSFRFAYGEGSFQRHLRALPGAGVLVRRGLALDLDTPADLVAARNHPRVRGVS
jgi:2-phospho-L-lactate guanylyltransferase